MGHTGWQETVRRARALGVEAMAITGSDEKGRLGPDAPEPGLEVAWLAGAVAWLAEAAPSWSQLTGEVPTERSYRQVLCVPALEVWLICWPRGGRLQLHDHGGASGALQVVDGELEERSPWRRPRPDGGGVRWRDRTVGPGAAVSFDGDYIHDVRNSVDPVATSVHVYSAASRPMAFYRVDGGLVRTVGRSEKQSLVEAEMAAEGRGDPDSSRGRRQGASRPEPRAREVVRR
jgi:hypothetical protein